MSDDYFHHHHDDNTPSQPESSASEQENHDRIDVRALRKRIGLSQASFSKQYNISLRTLQDWEQGRRKPQGPARVLLQLIDHNPQWVRDALRDKNVD